MAYPYLMILAGTPATTTFSGKSVVTTAPAPTLTFFPILQLGNTVALAPIKVPLPTLTPPQRVAPGAICTKSLVDNRDRL